MYVCETTYIDFTGDAYFSCLMRFMIHTQFYVALLANIVGVSGFFFGEIKWAHFMGKSFALG